MIFTNNITHLRSEQQAPRFDADEIRRAVTLLTEPGDVYGFVALKLKSKRGEVTGFFAPDHREDLVKQAAEFSGKCEAVCISLNPVHRAVLALRQNRVDFAGKGDSVAKSHIARRRRLFIDIDAIREGGISGISATDEEKSRAAKAIEAVRDIIGFKPTLVIDSGNGWQIIHAVDEPADDDT